MNISGPVLPESGQLFRRGGPPAGPAATSASAPTPSAAGGRATAHTATPFLDLLLQRMPFPVRALQMDGGSEFQGAGDAAGQIERLVIDREPIVYRFESGGIRGVEGGASADLLRRHLEAFDNPHVYRIAHIGWGTHDGALWGGPNFTWADWYKYYGSIKVHFGPQ